MVADNWFRQVERILEAMEISSDATRIRLATFRLEGESQIWWDWVKVSWDPKTMIFIFNIFKRKYNLEMLNTLENAYFLNGICE